MKSIALILCAATIMTGCGAIQTGSVSRAYETYENQDYQRTLDLISFAQKVNELPSELSAELNYLKAKTYAQQGDTEKSNSLFRYLAEHHRDTAFGYLAYKEAETSNNSD